jgi:hypothetical protein
MTSRTSNSARIDNLWERRRKLLALRGVLYPTALSVLILGLGGLGFWLLDPKVHS